MKTILMILTLLSVGATTAPKPRDMSAQSVATRAPTPRELFEAGWSVGWSDGWKAVKGQNAIPPPPPDAPKTFKATTQEESYKEGRIRGYGAGAAAATRP